MKSFCQKDCKIPNSYLVELLQLKVDNVTNKNIIGTDNKHSTYTQLDITVTLMPDEPLCPLLDDCWSVHRSDSHGV